MRICKRGRVYVVEENIYEEENGENNCRES